MAKKKPVVTLEHVAGTLDYIMRLAEALSAVVRELGGESIQTRNRPVALYDPNGWKKTCPEGITTTHQRRGKCLEQILVSPCLSAQQTVRLGASGPKRRPAKKR
jgi:hypothetical protein